MAPNQDKLSEKKAPSLGLTLLKAVLPLFLANSIMLIVVFSLYFGGFANTESYVSNLVVHVANHDTSFVGKSFEDLVNADIATAAPNKPSFRWLNASYDELVQSVSDGHAWGALYLAENSSAALLQSLQTPQGLALAQVNFIYDDARLQSASRYIISNSRTFIARFASTVGQQVLASLLQNSSTTAPLNNATLIRRVFDPIRTVERNLGVVTSGVIAGVTGLAAILLLIMANGFIMPLNPIFAGLRQGGMSLSKVLGIKYMILYILFFFITLWYTLLVYGFSSVQTTAQGPGGWVSFWMLHWLSMAALGFTVDAAALLLQKFSGMFLVPFIVLNVVSSFGSLSLMPSFYAWFVIYPMYHIYQACRAILYNGFNQLYINIPSLVAWMVSSAILSVILFIWRDKQTRAENAKKAASDSAESSSRSNSPGIEMASVENNQDKAKEAKDPENPTMDTSLNVSIAVDSRNASSIPLNV